MNSSRSSIGVLIRFANAEATLPAVLEALKRQTRQPDIILGVANNSTDRSVSLMRSAGAHIIEWNEKYDHSRVLNFGINNLHTDLVLMLSSHTVLESTDVIERMVSCFHDGNVACVSGKWDDDPYYSDAVTWDELKTKGLRFGSIYSNSMGMIRRSLWEQMPFNEGLETSEDYDWAIAQLVEGKTCCRLNFKFSYQRSGYRRDHEFARVVFDFARKYCLTVTWLGIRASLTRMLCLFPTRKKHTEYDAVKERLMAWLNSRIVSN